MHLPAFIVVYRKHHVISPGLKFALTYVTTIILFRFRCISLRRRQFHLNATVPRAMVKCAECIFHLHGIHRSICYIYSERASQRIVDARSNLRCRTSARSVSAGSSKQTGANAYGKPRLGRLEAATSSRDDARISARARFLSPWLESRRQALLSCRRDEIRYFVKVISPRKVSFRRVIASAPFPPTATALHATRAREEERRRRRRRSRGYAKRAHLEGRPVDIAGRDSALRASPVVNRGLRLKIGV